MDFFVYVLYALLHFLSRAFYIFGNFLLVALWVKHEMINISASVFYTWSSFMLKCSSLTWRPVNVYQKWKQMSFITYSYCVLWRSHINTQNLFELVIRANGNFLITLYISPAVSRWTCKTTTSSRRDIVDGLLISH